MQNGNSVLIVGGYGVVGQQIARLIRQRHPDLAIALGGPNPAKAESLASELGNARSIRIDVEQARPLQEFTPRAIINAVNDPRDQLLMDAVRRGIPLVDITRWTDRFRAALKTTRSASAARTANSGTRQSCQVRTTSTTA